MMLYGTVNYTAWSAELLSRLSTFDLLPIIEGTNPEPTPPREDAARADIETAVDWQHDNAHARKLIIESLSDDIYTELFNNVNPNNSANRTAQGLWQAIKKRYQEPDVLKTYLALHSTLITPYSSFASQPKEVHLQLFKRTMARLNDLAEIHGLERIPEWYQTIMMLESASEGRIHEAMANAPMKSIGKLKMKNLADDMVEGSNWKRELEVRRGGREGVRNDVGEGWEELGGKEKVQD